MTVVFPTWTPPSFRVPYERQLLNYTLSSTKKIVDARTRTHPHTHEDVTKCMRSVRCTIALFSFGIND